MENMSLAGLLLDITELLKKADNIMERMSKYIPNELIDRPKAGFAIPIGDWLRTSLRGWAEDLLSEQSLATHGYFNHEVIRKIWEQHVSGKYDHTNKLWSLLMFQAWYREWS